MYISSVGQLSHIISSKVRQKAGVLHVLTCKCFAPQRRAIFIHQTFKTWPEDLMLLASWLANALCATTACHFSTSTLQKLVRPFCAFWLENAFLASSVPFFDLQTCLAPQRRAIFPHLHVKNWSDPAVFARVPFFHIHTSKTGPAMRCSAHFDLKTRFSPPFFHICTSRIGPTLRCFVHHDLRYSRVPFFSSLLDSYLCTRRFSKPTFRTSGTTNHWKTRWKGTKMYKIYITAAAQRH